MARVSTICAILAVCLTCAQARGDEPVRMRTDGRIVDVDGNIIAVPNPSDPRNTEYDKYYSKVGANGKPGTTSNFYVNSDTNAGFIKKEINPPKDDETTAPATQKASPTVNNPGTTSIEIYKYPDRPIYDNLQDSGTIYGN